MARPAPGAHRRPMHHLGECHFWPLAVLTCQRLVRGSCVRDVRLRLRLHLHLRLHLRLRLRLRVWLRLTDQARRILLLQTVLRFRRIVDTISAGAITVLHFLSSDAGVDAWCAAVSLAGIYLVQVVQRPGVAK